MSNNLYDYKKRRFPEWYADGPVKTYTKEEIDEWEKGCHDDIWAKIEAQQGLKESDVKFLDAMREAQEEIKFNEILEGSTESNLDGVT